MKTISDEMPSAALLVREQKELFKNVLWEVFKEMGITSFAPPLPETLPETFGKEVCSDVTGYAVNTINRMICDKKIPYYKLNSRVLFRREEIRDWMLKNRVKTTDEYTAESELALEKKRRTEK